MDTFTLLTTQYGIVKSEAKLQMNLQIYFKSVVMAQRG